MTTAPDPAARPESVDAQALLPMGLTLVLLGWSAMAVQEVLLFTRPTPYGGPYVLHWDRYFWFAQLYNLLGQMLASLPFLLAWSLRRTPWTVAAARRGLTAQLVVIMLVTALDHADNEVMRFMGTHLTVSLLVTYGRIGAWGADNLRIILGDRGGPLLPFLVLVTVPALLWWLGQRMVRARLGAPRPWRPVARWSALVVLIVVPLIVFNLPGGRFRRVKVQPELLTLAFEVGQTARTGERPADYPALSAGYRTEWSAESGEAGWQFGPDSAYPLVRQPRELPAPTSAPRWNVIYLQLETFRAWNVGHLHPDPRGSATPFLDSLAASANGATWTRHLSFGPPTVSGFVAGHCSIRPHTDRNITTTFTYTALLCLPALLRERGWHTAYFTGSDPDWDNQTVWLRRWFDETNFYQDADEQDRIVFRRAGERIQELGRGDAPFFATVVSISNHYPFRSREAALDLTASADPQEAVRNTMHYTDDVVRELITGLARQPWFAHTLVVVVGDHGYNLGEHDGTAGQRNAWRESVWVPLVIAGAHPRLPRGRHPEIASLLDVAPTVADLLGIRPAVPWMGRSLLVPPGPGRTITMRRDGALYAEDDQFGLVLDASTGQPALYEAETDPLQQHDVAAAHSDVVRRLLERADRDQRLTDYLLETDQVWSATPAP